MDEQRTPAATWASRQRVNSSKISGSSSDSSQRRLASSANTSRAIADRLTSPDGATTPSPKCSIFEGAAAVAEHFGDGVVAPSGEVDRSAIARRVFADEAERRWLESLLLPLIFEEFTRWRDAQIAAGVPLLVHEAPTLFEAGVEGRYDAIVTITAPGEVREARRPGSAARMAAQLPEEEKARRSDYVYENTGDLEQLDAFVGRVMEALR